MKARRFAFAGRLDRYVGGLFLSSYLTALLVVLGLFFIMDMAANLDKYLQEWPDGSHARTSQIIRFYILNIPSLFLQSAPFITLAAGMFTVARLMKNREIAAALAAGIGARRVLLPVLLGGAVLAVGSFVLREVISGSISAEREALRFMLEEKRTDLVYERLYLRDLGGVFLRAEEFHPATEDAPVPEICGLLLTISKPGFRESIEATRAIYVEHDGGFAWKLENGVRKIVGEDMSESEVGWLEGFDFTPELATTYQRARKNHLDISFGEAVVMARRDPTNVAYQTLMQYHLTFPLANIVLLLVGLPMLLRHERGFGVEGIARGLLLCVFFFAADFVFRNLGIQGAIHPLLASWVPLLFFGSLGVVLFDSMRT